MTTDELANAQRALEKTPWITGLRDSDDVGVFYVTGNSGDSLGEVGMKLLHDDDGLKVYVGTFDAGAQRCHQVVIAAAAVVPKPGPHKEEYMLVYEGPTEDAWALFHAHVAMLPVRMGAQ